MKYPVIQTFREKPKFNRYVKGDIYETDEPGRAEYLQKAGFIGPEIQEKPKSKGKTAGKGKSDETKNDLTTVGESAERNGTEISKSMLNVSDSITSGGEANESS